MDERLISIQRKWAALLALALASALSLGLVVLRRFYAGQWAFGAFLWNLFLAWIPLLAALLFYRLAAERSRRWGVTTGAAIIWFLFFPNAPYLVTDIVHLYVRPPVPYWYDIICVMAFAQTGLFLGCLSLYLMQEVVRAWLGRWSGWWFALAMLALSSFGIYLGRFLRWNSWDALVGPLDTLRNAARLANPWTHPQPFAFSATFFAFSLVCYLIVYSFTHLHGWVQRLAPTAGIGDESSPEKVRVETQ
jgi:uncharacterized membrane protein